MASQTNYDHVRAAYDAEQLHHGDGKASLDIEKAIKASQLGRDHRDQLRNDLASLRVGLRDALLWDYPQENGAAACERVAHELGATCVIVAGAPFLFTEPSKIARNRRPRFAVLDDQRGPRWRDRKKIIMRSSTTRPPSCRRRRPRMRRTRRWRTL